MRKGTPYREFSPVSRYFHFGAFPGAFSIRRSVGSSLKLSLAAIFGQTEGRKEGTRVHQHEAVADCRQSSTVCGSRYEFVSNSARCRRQAKDDDLVGRLVRASGLDFFISRLSEQYKSATTTAAATSIDPCKPPSRYPPHHRPATKTTTSQPSIRSSSRHHRRRRSITSGK